jgi:hypothetical protein
MHDDYKAKYSEPGVHIMNQSNYLPMAIVYMSISMNNRSRQQVQIKPIQCVASTRPSFVWF